MVEHLNKFHSRRTIQQFYHFFFGINFICIVNRTMDNYIHALFCIFLSFAYFWLCNMKLYECEPIRITNTVTITSLWIILFCCNWILTFYSNWNARDIQEDRPNYSHSKYIKYYVQIERDEQRRNNKTENNKRSVIISCDWQ